MSRNVKLLLPLESYINKMDSTSLPQAVFLTTQSNSDIPAKKELIKYFMAL